MLGAAASGQTLRLHEFTFKPVAVASGKLRGVAHSHLGTYNWIIAFANLHLCIHTDARTRYLHLFTHTWILTLGYILLDTC